MKPDLAAKRPEDFCRNLLRAHISSIQWIEPTPGSSSGAPDAQITIGRNTYGLELKAWHLHNGKLEPDLRPTQYRYHRLGLASGKQTALLVLGGRPQVVNHTRAEVDPLMVYVVPAWRIDQLIGQSSSFGKDGLNPAILQAVTPWGSAMFGTILKDILLDEEFWQATPEQSIVKTDKLKRNYSDCLGLKEAVAVPAPRYSTSRERSF